MDAENGIGFENLDSTNSEEFRFEDWINFEQTEGSLDSWVCS